MVDEYRVMHAFSIDKGNPQYKGPFNAILNVSLVFTPADTAFVTPIPTLPTHLWAWICAPSRW